MWLSSFVVENWKSRIDLGFFCCCSATIWIWIDWNVQKCALTPVTLILKPAFSCKFKQFSEYLKNKANEVGELGRKCSIENFTIWYIESRCRVYSELKDVRIFIIIASKIYIYLCQTGCFFFYQALKKLLLKGNRTIA